MIEHAGHRNSHSEVTSSTARGDIPSFKLGLASLVHLPQTCHLLRISLTAISRRRSHQGGIVDRHGRMPIAHNRVAIHSHGTFSDLDSTSGHFSDTPFVL